MTSEWKPKKQDVWELAKALGIECYTWTPGDRCGTRYEFTWYAVGQSEVPGTIVCLGTREAWKWLNGFEAGMNHVRAQQAHIREAIHG